MVGQMWILLSAPCDLPIHAQLSLLQVDNHGHTSALVVPLYRCSAIKIPVSAGARKRFSYLTLPLSLQEPLACLEFTLDHGSCWYCSLNHNDHDRNSIAGRLAVPFAGRSAHGIEKDSPKLTARTKATTHHWKPPGHATSWRAQLGALCQAERATRCAEALHCRSFDADFLEGPISSLTAFGTTVILLHDFELAQQFLEKRAVVVSGRPRPFFLTEMYYWIHSLHYNCRLTRYRCGWVSNMGFMGYNQRLRAMRRHMYSNLGTQAAMVKYGDMQDIETRRFLLRWSNDPARFLDHIKR